MSFYTLFRNVIFALSKITTPIALVLTVISFILAWTGFAVPDWLSYTTVNAYQRKFGLWNTCLQSITFFSNGFSCVMWSATSEPLPDFLRTTQGLITIGTILTTFATFLGLLSLFLKRCLFKFLPVFASICALTAAVFIIIGLSVFGGDYSSYVSNVSGTSVARRWGYWIFIPAIVFLFFAALFFPFSYIYKTYISNRMYNFVGFQKGVTIPVPAGVSRRASFGNVEFAPRGELADVSHEESVPKFARKGMRNVPSKAVETQSVISLNWPIPSISNANEKTNETSFASTSVANMSQIIDDDFDSRFNGRYLERVFNNMPYYTEDSLYHSTDRENSDEAKWVWQKR